MQHGGFGTQNPGRPHRPWGLAVLIAVALLALISCSKDSRYKVLDFFFDGVPDPNAVEQDASGTITRRGNKGQTIFVHKPLITGQCNQCHKNEDTALVTKAAVPMQICRECHTKVGENIRVQHGPFASEQCLQCHTPHRSSEAHLLKVGGNDLCLQCHLYFELTPRVAEHMDLKNQCMDCHNAHGGETRAFLKAAYSTTRPATTRSTTQPTTQSVSEASDLP